MEPSPHRQADSGHDKYVTWDPRLDPGTGKKKKKGIKKMVFGPLGGSVERLISWGWPLYFACSLVINSIAPKLIS